MVDAGHVALGELVGWVAALSAASAAALLLWAIGPDREPSLSKELHPAHMVVITALALAFHLGRQRGRTVEVG